MLCFVGIFVYRSSYGWRNINDMVLNMLFYKVCMIFIGGRDDREVVIFVIRMLCDLRINLIVV